LVASGAVLGGLTRVVVSGQAAGAEIAPGFVPYENADCALAVFVPDGPTLAGDELLLYFTSGTTARPKLVPHTHESYPVGHLSTLYWIGLREGDVHCNISSPGWAKHAWSSFFAPWNAGATVFVHQFARFSAPKTLSALARCGVDTLCAPPTVWRMLILEDLSAYPVKLREAVSAGEPLNPEVIEQVRQQWGLTVRDGYGQTETAALIGNSPGQPVKIGSMGRPLPGYQVVLLDSTGREVDEGEIALRLHPRPLSLSAGYLGDPVSGATPFDREARSPYGSPSGDPQGPPAVADHGFYRTGDEAQRDADGYYLFVGRGDDVFKSSDYRISPFELESVLVEHELVAEAAVVPSPDATRLYVPKAYVVLRPGVEPDAAAAAQIFAFLRGRLAPYKRIRLLEFAELPKTISGKIRRVELRQMERRRQEEGSQAPREFRDGG
jgi:acetyl-CoA synthetase